MATDKIIEKILRVGVAFSFMYPPISAFFDPYAWVGYFPAFMIKMIPFDSILLLHLFGIFELVVALWILFGKRIFIPSLIASLSLFFIVAFNYAQMDVLFRDISILGMSIALCVLHKKDKSQSA